MDIKEYQRLAQRTSNTRTMNDKLINGGLGIAGEAGEVADQVKKWLFQGHDLDKEKIVEELGDVLWYAAETAEAIGKTLEDIMKENIRKLEERFPKGKFEESRSRCRQEG